MTPTMRTGPLILGWDVGGVNTKLALVMNGGVLRVQTRPFELQRAPHTLADLLREMATASLASLRGDPDHGATDDRHPSIHAVTMTAELSQMFRTKREGVAFVLDAVEAAFPGSAIYVYTTQGEFVFPADVRERPLAVAAANWFATAAMVARHHPDALVVDIGTTTADLIPIIGGQVAALGRTDPERLSSGELVYSGIVRTPVESIVSNVPVPGGRARVSAEGFALTGDAHLWLGTLSPGDYETATPDGRLATREFAGERLARVVCADREMLDDDAITTIARAIADAQVHQIATAMREVCARHPSLQTAVVTGLGAGIGARAAAMVGLTIIPLSSRLGDAGARSAPATAIALLLAQQLASEGTRGRAPAPTVRAATSGITVVKLGGGLIAHSDQWRAAISALASSSRSTRLVVVPGGGPFADAARDVDVRFGIGGDTAHWMAIAGMDQHAEMIAGARPEFVRVRWPSELATVHARGAVPVLALLEWLRESDPLPHSWDVTSDSLAAWVAGRIHASRLVLVKPAGATGATIVDPYFERALPAGLPWATCHALELEALLRAPAPSAD